MRITEDVKNQEEKDYLLAVAMHPKVLEYCEQLRDLGIDFEIVRVDDPEKRKARKLAEFITHEYPVGMDDAERVVTAAMKAADKCKVEATLILALAARESSFKGGSDGTLSGLMRVRPQSHPDELRTLETEALQPDSVEGNIRLGAEIIARYQRESAGDISQALQRYHGAKDDPTKSYSKAVASIKQSLDTALQNF